VIGNAHTGASTFTFSDTFVRYNNPGTTNEGGGTLVGGMHGGGTLTATNVVIETAFGNTAGGNAIRNGGGTVTLNNVLHVGNGINTLTATNRANWGAVTTTDFTTFIGTNTMFRFVDNIFGINVNRVWRNIHITA